MKIFCPRCKELGGQGAIYKARLPNLNIVLSICDECEACWMQDQPINGEKFNFLTLFLNKNSITYKDFCLNRIDLGYIEKN
jgi:hypothetical protein